MRLLLLAASACALSSCASMSKNECVYADWRAIGFEDGAAGEPSTAISSRRQACAAAGVTPNMSEYLAGRDAGLAEYCTPANGFSEGESGSSYSGVCGRHNEAGFLAEYRAGSHLYLLRDRSRGASYALVKANEDLGAMKFAISHAATSLIRPDLTVTERAALVVEMTRLNEESERVERSLPALRTNVDIADAELMAYETQLASRPGARPMVAARY
jgi:hypothetical protein